uniref:Uncharacterized protein n=1 Tax=Amphimedon queenslandica TaxID=400682 RepID=A0A1X7SPK4_AMPQE
FQDSASTALFNCPGLRMEFK